MLIVTMKVISMDLSAGVLVPSAVSMDTIWSTPAIQTVLGVVILGALGLLVKLFTLWSAKLTQLIDMQMDQTRKVEAVSLTATKTETLVNSQRSEMKLEIDQWKSKFDALQSELKAVVATASAEALRLAAQTSVDAASALALAVAQRPITVMLPAAVPGAESVALTPTTTVTAPVTTIEAPVMVVAPTVEKP